MAACERVACFSWGFAGAQGSVYKRSRAGRAGRRGRMDRRLLGRIYRRVVHKYFVQDLMLDLRLRAKQETVDYIAPHLGTAMLLPDRYALLDHALDAAAKARPGGLHCEFGVAGGKTLRHIAARTPGLVHGFDSFEGLPEDWVGTAERAGKFSQKGRLPKVPSNVRLHQGWFDATLPPFLERHREPVSFLHMDADIYSSTRTVLMLLRERIGPGAVLQFDEYTNYPGWKLHEHRAFQEFVAETGLKYRYIGFSTLQGQAAVQILEA
jgi:hypothetical protein